MRTIGVGLKVLWRELSASPNNSELPARVRAEIARREASTEQLIGWVQLGIVLIYAMLFWISPLTGDDRGEGFAPYSLGVYFAFTLFRVWLSYRIPLPNWFVVLSIIVDIALLCALIVSLHLEYHQPAAFSLKVPAFVSMFVFISLRTLRFDPRFVLLTGAAAVTGWLGILAYAVITDRGEMRLTENFVLYLTSNSIMISAEVVKLAALIIVTAVLSLSLYRARGVTIAAVRNHVAANDLRQFFAADVANSIIGADHVPVAGSSVTRDAAILFVDIRGFTKTAEDLPPETVVRILGMYQNAAATAIERHNGQIDKFLGDGILATFGAVRSSETYAADALRAVLAIHEEMAKLGPDLRAAGWSTDFRLGLSVASGTVTVGVVGAHNRLEFTVIGNPVNEAAKLEDANKVQGTTGLTDAGTLARARTQGYEVRPLDMRPGTMIEGLSAPIDLVVLI